ncbi:uncharacterized protein VTP21DRAFT_4139 [Calcarisporiella thermophila]|uniref:uncharacterized protein n=1 Tax=Calcarisporiella thermophila TaxID=911321 RepID=UPI0037442EE4
MSDPIGLAAQYERDGNLKEAYAAYTRRAKLILQKLRVDVMFSSKDKLHTKPDETAALFRELYECLQKSEKILQSTPIAPSRPMTPTSVLSRPSSTSSLHSPSITDYAHSRRHARLPQIPLSPLVRQLLMSMHAGSVADRKLNAMVNTKPKPATLSPEAKRLYEQVKYEQQRQERTRAWIRAASAKKFSQWRPDAIARQIAIIDARLFAQVALHSDASYSAAEGGTAGEEVAGVKLCVDFHQFLTHSLAHQLIVLDPTEDLVTSYVQVADRLLHSYRDFNGFVAVCKALTCPEVRRLQRLWSRVPSRTREVLKVLEEYISPEGYYARYKSLLAEKVAEVCATVKRSEGILAVPWMEAHLEDMKANEGLSLLERCQRGAGTSGSRPDLTRSFSSSSSSRSLLEENGLDPVDLRLLGDGDLALHHWLVSRVYLTSKQLIEESIMVEPLRSGETLLVPSLTPNDSPSKTSAEAIKPIVQDIKNQPVSNATLERLATPTEFERSLQTVQEEIEASHSDSIPSAVASESSPLPKDEPAHPSPLTSQPAPATDVDATQPEDNVEPTTTDVTEPSQNNLAPALTNDVAITPVETPNETEMVAEAPDSTEPPVEAENKDATVTPNEFASENQAAVPEAPPTPELPSTPSPGPSSSLEKESELLPITSRVSAFEEEEENDDVWMGYRVAANLSNREPSASANGIEEASKALPKQQDGEDEDEEWQGYRALSNGQANEEANVVSSENVEILPATREEQEAETEAEAEAEDEEAEEEEWKGYRQMKDLSSTQPLPVEYAAREAEAEPINGAGEDVKEEEIEEDEEEWTGYHSLDNRTTLRPVEEITFANNTHDEEEEEEEWMGYRSVNYKVESPAQAHHTNDVQPPQEEENDDDDDDDDEEWTGYRPQAEPSDQIQGKEEEDEEDEEEEWTGYHPKQETPKVLENGSTNHFSISQKSEPARGDWEEDDEDSGDEEWQGYLSTKGTDNVSMHAARY